MAEILICARNVTHADPEKDRRGCWKRGYPVCVRPDGHQWGAKETLPRFVVVKISGVSVAQVERVIDAQTEDDAGVDLFEDDGVTPRTFRRRRWRVLVDNVPAAIRNELLTTGSVTVTPTQIRNYVRRIRDNAQLGGL